MSILSFPFVMYYYLIGSSIPTSSTILSELPFYLVLFGSFIILALLFRYFNRKSSQ